MILALAQIRHRVAEVAKQLAQEGMVVAIGRGRTIDRRNIRRLRQIQVSDLPDDAVIVEINLNRLLFDDVGTEK